MESYHQSEREKLYVEFLSQFFEKLNAVCKKPEIRREATSHVMLGLRHLWESDYATDSEAYEKNEQFLATLREGYLFAKRIQKDSFILSTLLLTNYERIGKVVPEITEKEEAKPPEEINPSTEDAVQESPPSES